MSILNKHFWKFLVGLIAMMFFGLSVAYGTNWYEKQRKFAEYQKQRQVYEAYQAQYLNDTYGSTTPEGTLGLFIDALKKNDIDLAVKYVYVDEREKVKNDLDQVVKDGKLDSTIFRLESLRLSQKDESSASFIKTDKLNVLQNQVLIAKNSNGVWKIMDF